MASFGCIHQAIARLQAVSASQLQLEPVCVGPFRAPFERKLQAFAHFKRPELSIHSAVRSGLLVFATASQDTATPTLVLQEVDFVWKGKGSQVLLTGDFLDWDAKVSLEKGTDGAFHYKQKLSPGTYKYKYIIDGEWAHSPDCPMIEDGKGGYNNQIIITDGPLASTNSLTQESSPKETAGVKDTGKPAPKAAAPPKAAKADTTAAAAPTAAAPPKAVPVTKPAKKVEKPYPEVITEDVIPRVKSFLQKEEGISDVELVFQDNQVEGSFLKGGIIYTFWAFFPDGKLEGSRGFSVSSHGSPPSTVEPFLIDEKKITADLLVFWFLKRLAAQRIISSKRI
ncbi:hypothetical protein GOP47_0002932 [Adiantum capillus-veneris]|uniref:AMP-activated protein kinase glycogen-binding domain-containing protein n=1 Tax=Adiantum capillus-veneris TaxID=13818 RepID=A0A9D4VB93_ADICA|nr:hypothetical protein GOP47_0002932 [Adiantum capillus-veneris]